MGGITAALQAIAYPVKNYLALLCQCCHCPQTALGTAVDFFTDIKITCIQKAGDFIFKCSY